MQQKMATVLAARQPGVKVADLCRELGISRSTFYEWRDRAAGGDENLKERSRRPHLSPGLISAELEETIIRLRKELPVDNGAQTIAYHLRRRGLQVPAVSTINRVLSRRGMVVPQPEKRPRSSFKRFEYEAPNACWQIDATEWALADGTKVEIMDILDDYSRVSTAAVVGSSPSTALAIEAMQNAFEDWGIPAQLLSDNGTCFRGVLKEGNSASSFERFCAGLGIKTIHSSPRHPQTCGKIERWHQTLKKSLKLEPRAASKEELQAQLDTFRRSYNFDRPHKAAKGGTPAERFGAMEPASPGDSYEVTGSVAITHPKVTTDGVVDIAGSYRARVGSDYAGMVLTAVRFGDRIVIHDGSTVVRAFTLDRTKTYQPSGKPRGGPRRRP